MGRVRKGDYRRTCRKVEIKKLLLMSYPHKIMWSTCVGIVNVCAFTAANFSKARVISAEPDFEHIYEFCHTLLFRH